MKKILAQVTHPRKSKRVAEAIIDSPVRVAAVASSLNAEVPSTEVSIDLDLSARQAAWTTLKGVLKTVSDGCDLFLPLKAALVGVVSAMDKVNQVRGAQSDFLNAVRRIQRLLDILSPYKTQDDISPAMKNSSEIISRELCSIKGVIESKTRRGLPRRTLEAADDVAAIAGAFRHLADMVDDLQLGIGLRTEQTVHCLVATGAIKELGGVLVADIQSQSAEGCMDGTRVALLEELSGWSRDRDAPRIFWLDGMAGTGKSAVARSFCHRLREGGWLGGSFFCSRRGTPEERDAKRILPTLASSLSYCDAAYKQALLGSLEKETFSAHANLQSQMKSLFSNPFRSIPNEKQPTWILVIDALDECADDGQVKDLLNALQSISASLPVKFFLTSRPERHIRTKLQSPHSNLHRIFRLHDIDLDLVEGDLSLYITKRLEDVRAEHSDTVPPNWPSRADIAAVTRRAGKLFIYAFTAIEYIREDPLEYLPKLTGLVVTAGRPLTEPLDDIYTAILSRAMDPRKIEHEDIALTQRTLTAIFTVREPLPVLTISTLFGITEPKLRTILGRLHSVISVPDHNNATGVVSTFHASFGDFLTTHGRAPESLLITSSDGHLDLGARCIAAMESDQLRFNMSQCPSSYFPNSQQTLAEIPAALQYACMHWPYHIAALEDPSSLLPALEAAFLPKFLFWLEVLSAMGKADTASSLIRTALISKGFVHASKRLTGFLHEAAQFAASSLDAISFNTAHIYLSALPSVEPASLIGQEFLPYFSHLPVLEAHGISRRQSAELHLLGHTDQVNSVTFSPDGRQIISGSRDGTIRIWDAQTGALAMPPLEGHAGAVRSVTSSPNGMRIASGSEDTTIRVWDLQTGVLAMPPLEGHIDFVLSVAFSPDGTRIVSGSGDGDTTIRIWDTQTGLLTVPPLEGHTEAIWSVAFSPDGSHVVSGSADTTIRVWNAQAGVLARAPFVGHTGEIYSVAFSPDGTHIVSSSDDFNIRLWYTQTGVLVMPPLQGHDARVTSAAFSRDGARIVSGSDDKTIRTWDVQTGALMMPPVEGHAGPILSVAFSPDGTRVISGSQDKTICTWETQMGMLAIPPLETYTGVIFSIAVSPDGTRIVSGSVNFKIRVWYKQTGMLVMPPLKGHAGTINCVAFSPDSTRIASCSDDRTVRIWDAQTGVLVMPPLEGHTDQVWSVAFSPEGTRIASGSRDETIRVWDARTGVLAINTLEGHVGGIYSVAFSPDGTRLVSASNDKTIRFWDTQSGALMMQLKGHTKAVRSVAFSPDGLRIVSCSNDETVRIWDAQTGVLAIPPLKGHSDWILSVAFSPDGKRIASGSGDKTIRVWDAQTGVLAMPPLIGHADITRSVAFSPNGTHIVSGSDDKTIRVWNVDEGSMVNTATGTVTADQNYLSLPGSQGWVKGPQGQHMLWVPPEYRPYMQLASNVRVMGEARATVDMSRTVHGERWTECYTPRPRV